MLDPGDYTTVVGSSNIEALGYDDEEKSLYVRFLGKGNRLGSLYKYAGVESEVMKRLVDAPSKGKAFYQLIRDKYDYEKVE